MLSINPINQGGSDSFYHEALGKLGRLKGSEGGKSDNQERLKKASNAFEAILLYQMFKSMNDNIVKASLIQENQGEKIFKDFLLKQRSENIANNASLGIAKLIYEQFSKNVDQ